MLCVSLANYACLSLFVLAHRPYRNRLDNLVESGQLAVLSLITAQLSNMPLPLTSDESVGMGFLTFVPFAALVVYMIANRWQPLKQQVQKATTWLQARRRDTRTASAMAATPSNSTNKPVTSVNEDHGDDVQLEEISPAFQPAQPQSPTV